MPTGTLFDVDVDGFKQTIRGEAARILQEPISNALDTEASAIAVEFIWENGVASYTVEDNDPDGFASLKDAYTLFAPSTRKADIAKRGRFGFGEKEFIALCYPGEVLIASTTGSVRFRGDRRIMTRANRAGGSIVEARLELTRAEANAFIRRVRSLIVPYGVSFTFRYRMAKTTHEWAPSAREEVASFQAVLPTVSVDDHGNLRPTRRATTVRLYEPAAGEQPMIYELGVPVVDHDDRFHIDVSQKVPLNRSRDNVTPAYLRTLRELVLNHTYQRLTAVDAKTPWVTEALPAAEPEALRRVVEEIHGTDAVIYDPSNPEASKKAIEQGRTVVHGRQFPAVVWEAVRRHGVLKPAGQVIETGVPVAAKGKEPIPSEDWTEPMVALASYTKELGRFLLDHDVEVSFEQVPRSEGGAGDFAAWWDHYTLTFNLGSLGKRWPERAAQQEVDALVIHEFAHHFARDHYSAAFYGACCRLGAKLRRCPTSFYR
jgi:hypothetical protein